MPAVKYDLNLEQGASFALSLTWKDSNGNPVDLTGATAHMQIRTGTANLTGSTAPLVDLTETSGITLGGISGTIDIKITKAQTAPLHVSRGMYDLLVTTAGGDTYRLMEGAVNIDPAVTL